MYRFIHMRRHWTKQSVFDAPGLIGWLIILANTAVFAFCANAAGTTTIPADMLLRIGAMYAGAIERHEYWRLVAYGFLHADLLHLTSNMICLVLWGGLLEKRIGGFYFALVYAVALAGGAIVANFAHTGPYLVVGASGAVSGLLGALLCVWILARVDLSAIYFALTIGLNVALALSVPKTDWAAHLGGFVAGLLCCAVLDLLEKANRYLLKCRFPESIKLNLLFATGASSWLLWLKPALLPVHLHGELQYGILIVAVFLLALKMIDIALSMKRGLVFVVLALAAINASLTFMIATTLAPRLASVCNLHGARFRQLSEIACSNLNLTIAFLAAVAFALTMLLHSRSIYRGFKDVGFVGASLQAERKRRQGI